MLLPLFGVAYVLEYGLEYSMLEHTRPLLEVLQEVRLLLEPVTQIRYDLLVWVPMMNAEETHVNQTQFALIDSSILENDLYM